MTNPNDVAQIKHLDSLASHVNVLGSASSTVDGGLWYGFDSGLPVVKMNYGGGEFLIDTHFDGDNVLIGDVLYLGGHEFKLTGFADGLTFSDTDFYVGGISTPIGSVSNFDFQFTDAAALSVAEGGTIAITQLDTDTVDYSLNLPDTALHWSFQNYKPSTGTTGTYTYFTSTDASYLRTGDAAYISSSTSTEQYKFDLTIIKGLTPTPETALSPKNLSKALKSANPAFTAAEFAEYVTVEEIYDATSGKLTKFDITINSDDAIKNGSTWLSTITATTAKVTDSTGTNDVTATIKFNGTITIGEYDHKKGELTCDKTTGVYTFKTDTYSDGYSSATSGNTTTLTKETVPDEIIKGDECTIKGLADGLVAVRTDAYKYTLYKETADDKVIYYTAEDPPPEGEGKSIGDYKSGGTQVGTISFGKITITNRDAFADTSKAGVIATLTDTQKGKDDNSISYLAYYIDVDDALKNPTDTLESFVKQIDGTYKYTSGKKIERFTAAYPQITNYTQTNTVSYVPEETLGVEGLDLSITGIPDLGKLIINGNKITKEDGTQIGEIDHTNKTITLGTQGSIFLLLFGTPQELTINGFNGYVFSKIWRSNSGHASFRKSGVILYGGEVEIGYLVDTYSAGYSLSDDKKTATYRSGRSEKVVRHLTRPTGYIAMSYSDTVAQWAPYISAEEYNALSNEEKTAYNNWDGTKYYLRISVHKRLSKV